MAYLDLRSNHFREIPSESLRSLPHLIACYLGHNLISYIPDGSFETNSKLLQLSFEANRIVELGQKAFMGLHNNVHITISDNRIRSIPDGLFAFLPDTANITIFVDMRNNPFDCGCHLAYFKKWLLKPNVHDYNVYCETPLILKDIPVSMATLNCSSKTGIVMLNQKDQNGTFDQIYKWRIYICVAAFLSTITLCLSFYVLLNMIWIFKN